MVCSIFMFFALHLGWWYVDALECRTKVDWVHQVDYLVNAVFAGKKKVWFVLDICMLVVCYCSAGYMGWFSK